MFTPLIEISSSIIHLVFGVFIGSIGAVGTGFVAYILFGLIFSTLARKLGYEKPWIAWIPVVQLFILPILAEKKKRWGIIFLVPVVNLTIGFILWIVCLWHIFERRNYPGWLSLLSVLSVIPVIGVIINVVILCIVAFRDRS